VAVTVYRQRCPKCSFPGSCETSGQCGWFSDPDFGSVLPSDFPAVNSYLWLLTTAEVLLPYGVAALSNAQAWATLEKWLDVEGVSFVDEPRGIVGAWASLALRSTSSPKLWMDSYLAAFAIAGGYQLITSDNAFRQFKGLNLRLLPLS
jgi:predicted nucleic acid-binding protein